MSSTNKAPDAKPVEAKPVDAKAVEPKPAEPKPVEPKPVEARPVEAKAAEPKKAEPRKADAATTRPEPARAETLKPEPAKGDGIVKIDGRPKGKLVEPSLDSVDTLDCDSLVLHLTSDVRPLAGVASYVDWRLCGRLSELVARGVITGARGEHVLIPTHGRIGPGRIFVFGWGPHRAMLDGATEILRSSVDVVTRAKALKVAIALPEPASRLVGLVDEHIVKPFGDRLVCVFAPDGLIGEKKDTRPIPAPALN